MATGGRVTNGPSALPLSVEGPSLVPKTFHFIWFGELPEHLAALVDTWVNLHPSWEFKRWNWHNLPELRNQELFDQSEQIAGKGCYQLMSDILRYEVLQSEGGVYVDCDFECQRSIDDILRLAGPAFAVWEITGQWLANGLLGFVPGHPLMEQLIAELPESVERRQPRDRPNRISGPQYFTPRALHHGIQTLPSKWFIPYGYAEVEKRQHDSFPDAYAVHHWNNKRRRFGISWPKRLL